MAMYKLKDMVCTVRLLLPRAGSVQVHADAPLPY